MFYASYAKLRSLQSPRGYRNELLLKHPIVVMGLIWVTWLTYWTIIVLSLRNSPLTFSVNVHENILNLIFIIPWCILLFSVCLISIKITLFLFKNATRRRGVVANHQHTSSLNTLILVSDAFTLPYLRSSFFQNYFVGLINKLRDFRLSAEAKFIIIVSSFLCQWYVKQALLNVTFMLHITVV
jgi:hypothetical protein